MDQKELQWCGDDDNFDKEEEQQEARNGASNLAVTERASVRRCNRCRK